MRAWAEAALFYLAPLPDAEPFPSWTTDIDEPPLVAPTVAGSGVVVATGIHVGPVLIEVGPPPTDAVAWEERGSTQIDVREPLALAIDGEEPTIVFSPARVGRHHVDVYAMNRDVNRDLALKPNARKKLERYLFVFTPID